VTLKKDANKAALFRISTTPDILLLSMTEINFYISCIRAAILREARRLKLSKKCVSEILHVPCDQ